MLHLPGGEVNPRHRTRIGARAVDGALPTRRVFRTCKFLALHLCPTCTILTLLLGTWNIVNEILFYVANCYAVSCRPDDEAPILIVFFQFPGMISSDPVTAVISPATM